MRIRSLSDSLMEPKKEKDGQSSIESQVYLCQGAFNGISRYESTILFLSTPPFEQLPRDTVL